MTIIADMLKHLPPSKSQLRLLDISPQDVQTDITLNRPDIAFTRERSDVDAVFGYGVPSLKPVMLEMSLNALRPGGRMILYFPALDLSLDEVAAVLQEVGFARILTETLDDGILARGERPYAHGMTTAARVAVGAQDVAVESEILVLSGDAIHDAPGRYIHLLIKQTPNKPLWKLEPGETISWQAAALDHPLTVIGFTSLPKAVQLMQAAVMDGMIKDVSKIAKFSKATAAGWDFWVLLNPDLAAIKSRGVVIMIDIDPDSAEAPDE
ncbi:MAG: hypothetical protein L0154_28925 [Chloroflexi bacterium]|nr:hypothetical protein [Chloroflexota bacterium]